MLGVRMAFGRGFLPGEDSTDAPPVAILSHALWQARFGGDAGVVGTAIRLNDSAHTIVGIARREFSASGPAAARVWVPLSSLPVLRA